MAKQIDLSYAIGLPPEKAIEYFKSKGLVLTWDWNDLWQEAHSKAFTIAKVMRMDILQDIKGKLDKALENGTTLQDFRKNLEPTLKAKGWWGYKFVSKEDGTLERVLEGSPWRLKTIFQTNMQNALSAGKYKEQMELKDERPYWQYVAVMDSRTRPAHRLLNGKVFRYDDPFWETHYPPLGFNCRCRVRALSEDEVKARGLKIESAQGKIKWVDQVVNKKTGVIEKVAVFKDDETGKSIPTDAGFSYNPGEAAFFPNLDKYDYKVAKQWIMGALTSPDFLAFWDGIIKGNYPVAVIDKKYMDAIKSKSQVVNLSSDTLKKQILEHPEITLKIYQQLPNIIENAQLIVKDRDTAFVFLRIDKEIYYGAIKTTKTGLTNFLTSLRKAELNDIKAIKKKGEIIKDEL